MISHPGWIARKNRGGFTLHYLAWATAYLERPCFFEARSLSATPARMVQGDRSIRFLLVPGDHFDARSILILFAEGF
jgi:hypothetical protein